MGSSFESSQLCIKTISPDIVFRNIEIERISNALVYIIHLPWAK